jgi:hypothetical protein
LFSNSQRRSHGRRSLFGRLDIDVLSWKRSGDTWQTTVHYQTTRLDKQAREKYVLILRGISVEVNK